MNAHPICMHRDHALLCSVVGEANRQIREDNRGNVTRRALMSAFCYCKLAGVPVERRFLINPSGPVSEELIHDIESLELDEAIKNVSMQPDHHADYTTGVGALALCAEHRTWLNAHRETVGAVLKVLAPLTTSHLAQVACMHFLFLVLAEEQGPDLKKHVVDHFLAACLSEGWLSVERAEAETLYDAMASVRLTRDPLPQGDGKEEERGTDDPPTSPGSE